MQKDLIIAFSDPGAALQDGARHGISEMAKRVCALYGLTADLEQFVRVSQYWNACESTSSADLHSEDRLYSLGEQTYRADQYRDFHDCIWEFLEKMESPDLTKLVEEICSLALPGPEGTRLYYPAETMEAERRGVEACSGKKKIETGIRLSCLLQDIYVHTQEKPQAQIAYEKNMIDALPYFKLIENEHTRIALELLLQDCDNEHLKFGSFDSVMRFISYGIEKLPDLLIPESSSFQAACHEREGLVDKLMGGVVSAAVGRKNILFELYQMGCPYRNVTIGEYTQQCLGDALRYIVTQLQETDISTGTKSFVNELLCNTFPFYIDALAHGYDYAKNQAFQRVQAKCSIPGVRLE